MGVRTAWSLGVHPLLSIWKVRLMLGWLRKVFGGSSGPSRVPGDTSPGGAYSGLRAQALSIRRGEVGFPAPPAGAPVWGLLMETGYPGATATIMALVDGTTSLYISSGGGVIGGQGHESVREANATLLETANRLRRHLQPTASFPVPEVGRTLFYALTDSGILTGGGPEDDLGHGRLPLSPLFHAGHGVLTQLRLISEGAGQDA
jgi:hypothetical protein